MSDYKPTGCADCDVRLKIEMELRAKITEMEEERDKAVELLRVAAPYMYSSGREECWDDEWKGECEGARQFLASLDTGSNDDA